MKRILLTLLMVAFIAAPATAANPHPKQFDSVRALAWTTEVMVGIDFENETAITTKVLGNHCTITSINQKRHLWLTAAHCVMDENMQSIEEHDYQIGNPDVGYTPAEVVAADGDKDIAVLYAPGVSVKALKLSDHDVTFGDKLKVIGHPFGFPDALIFFGTVANPVTKPYEDDKPYMIYQLAGAPGNSGSAVLNDHDEIVSVLQVSWDRTFTPVTAGAPWAVLHEFLTPYVR